MTATIKCFAEALADPRNLLPSLAGLSACRDAQGVPLMERVTQFAEAAVQWNGEFWLLAMPLNDSALRSVSATVAHLAQHPCGGVAECRILHDAMVWYDDMGRRHTETLVAQPLGLGCSFGEAVHYNGRATLLAALDALERSLSAAGFAHNNLKARNLRYADGKFTVLRCYDATVGANADFARDRAAFEELRREVRLTAANDAEEMFCDNIGDTEGNTEGNTEELCGCFEGRRRISDGVLVGFADTNGRTVVEPRFCWAEDFREGRAVVATFGHYGVIDIEGRYVIEPEYEMVEYDSARSLFHARKHGRWTTMDYSGRQLTPFSMTPNPEFEF